MGWDAAKTGRCLWLPWKGVHVQQGAGGYVCGRAQAGGARRNGVVHDCGPALVPGTCESASPRMQPVTPRHDGYVCG